MDPQPRLFYLRDSHRNPVGAVAVTSLPPNSIDGIPIPLMFMSASVCHPLDEFSKVRARQIAIGRLDALADKTLAFPFGPACPPLTMLLDGMEMGALAKRGVDWEVAETIWQHQVALVQRDFMSSDEAQALTEDAVKADLAAVLGVDPSEIEFADADAEASRKMAVDVTVGAPE